MAGLPKDRHVKFDDGRQGAWRKVLPNLPGAKKGRLEASTAMLNGKFYVMGGVTGDYKKVPPKRQK